ncbi:rab9 effector protein with kelch motifs isoform 2-T2 [Ara ararauna]
MGPRALPPLERGRRPQRGKWYRLSPRGERPRGRVGHGCVLLPGRVLIVGGADPGGAFADAHFVELCEGPRWAAAAWSGLRPRYEHATFLPAAGTPRVWVFGGAHPAGNRNCVQVLDPATLTWSQPDTHGDPPSPRHGHVMVAVGTKLFVHGGLAGDVFYSDLFCIDTADMRWVKVPATGDIPGGRASHASAVFKDHLYIFGGIGPEGTLDTTYQYHTEKQQWTLLHFDAPLPAARLDHAMCVIPWQAGKSEHTGAAATGEATAGPLLESQDEGHAGATVVHLLLVFGGMDTQGEIYRDCIVSLIE